MIHLLPDVCRDCGRSADEVTLSPYLDFHLCNPCIARRERELFAKDSRSEKRTAPPRRHEARRTAGAGKPSASGKSESEVSKAKAGKPQGGKAKPGKSKPGKGRPKGRGK